MSTVGRVNGFPVTHVFQFSKYFSNGDSGGPLMKQYEGGNTPYWFLAGVVSYGPTPCGQEGWPGVYTRVSGNEEPQKKLNPNEFFYCQVSKYISWIESKLQP